MFNVKFRAAIRYLVQNDEMVFSELFEEVCAFISLLGVIPCPASGIPTL